MVAQMIAKMISYADTSDIAVDAIHGDWRDAWGQSIEDFDLRQSIESNPRFSSRIVASMLRTAAGNQHVDSPDQTALSDDDRVVFEMVKAQFSDLINMAGLVWYSNVFARSIQSGDLEALTEHIHLDALKNAVRLRHVAPDEAPASMSVEHLPKAVESQGTRCLLAWAEKMPVSVKARINLLISKDFERTYPILETHQSHGHRIIYAVTELLSGSKNLNAHDSVAETLGTYG